MTFITTRDGTDIFYKDWARGMPSQSRFITVGP